MYGRFFSRFRTEPRTERWTSQTGAIARPTRIRNSPRLTEWVARYSSAMRCLALTTAAVEDRDTVGSGKAMHSAAETTSHTHEMLVVEVVFRAVVESPPPFSKATS